MENESYLSFEDISLLITISHTRIWAKQTITIPFMEELYHAAIGWWNEQEISIFVSFFLYFSLPSSSIILLVSNDVI